MKLFIFVLLTIALSGGCTVYQTAPTAYTTTPASTSKFDQSWSAAIGAFADQGVRITVQDRSAGVIHGVRGNIRVDGSIRTQADGSVRVEFNTTGATTEDPTLIERITRSYNSRMGR